MITITTATDISAWLANENPCNWREQGTAEEKSRLVEALRTAPDRPAWGKDWQEWLETRGVEIVHATMEFHN